MFRVRIEQATGLKLARMVAFGFWAMAEEPNIIIVRVPAGKDFKDTLKYLSAGIIRHEITHLRQMQELGILGDSFHYAYWLENIVHGYEGNKYEIEARAAETDTSIEYEIINKGEFNE
jgi:hypothetical protein